MLVFFIFLSIWLTSSIPDDFYLYLISNLFYETALWLLRLRFVGTCEKHGQVKRAQGYNVIKGCGASGDKERGGSCGVLRVSLIPRNSVNSCCLGRIPERYDTSELWTSAGSLWILFDKLIMGVLLFSHKFSPYVYQGYIKNNYASKLAGKICVFLLYVCWCYLEWVTRQQYFTSYRTLVITPRNVALNAAAISKLC